MSDLDDRLRKIEDRLSVMESAIAAPAKKPDSLVTKVLGVVIGSAVLAFVLLVLVVAGIALVRLVT